MTRSEDERSITGFKFHKYHREQSAWLWTPSGPNHMCPPAAAVSHHHFTPMFHSKKVGKGSSRHDDVTGFQLNVSPVHFFRIRNKHVNSFIAATEDSIKLAGVNQGDSSPCLRLFLCNKC